MQSLIQLLNGYSSSLVFCYISLLNVHNSLKKQLVCSQILCIFEINLLGEVVVLKCDSTWYVPLVTHCIVTQIALKNVDPNLYLNIVVMSFILHHVMQSY